MKKLLFLFTMLTFMVACSDDDDNENDPSGGEEITLLSKRISKIKEYEGEGSLSLTYEYKYDAEGRIDEITETDHGNSVVYKYTYDADKITMKSTDKREENYILQNGKATYYKFDYGSYESYEGDWDEYRFTYNGDYMSLVKGIIETDSPETETLSFDKGKLVKYTYVADDDKDYTGSIDFEYGDQKNNLNIDLFTFIASSFFDGNFEDVWLLGVGGKRSSYLPKSATFTDPEWDDEEEEIIGQEVTKSTFEYKLKDGYITELAVYDEDKEIDWKFEIFYEE